MNAWLIGTVCCLGAGFIAFWCSYRRLWWPLLGLTILTAIIALQLYSAFKGNGTYHDLAALRAMNFTVTPALAATIIGLVVGDRMGPGLNWRSWQGLVTGLAMLVAIGAIVAARLI